MIRKLYAYLYLTLSEQRQDLRREQVKRSVLQGLLLHMQILDIGTHKDTKNRVTGKPVRPGGPWKSVRENWYKKERVSFTEVQIMKDMCTEPGQKKFMRDVLFCFGLYSSVTSHRHDITDEVTCLLLIYKTFSVSYCNSKYFKLYFLFYHKESCKDYFLGDCILQVYGTNPVQDSTLTLNTWQHISIEASENTTQKARTELLSVSSWF